MILAKDNYRVLLFEPRHVDEAARLLANSFVTLNPIWNAFGVDEDTAFKIIRSKIHVCAIYPYSYILVDQNDKMVGCSVQSDFYTLQQQAKSDIHFDHKDNIEMFKFLNKIQDELEGHIWSEPTVPGSTIYCLYAATAPELANQRIASYLFHAAFMNGKVNGLKNYYTRVTNPLTRKMLLNLGGVEASKIVVNLPEKGINNLVISLINIQFQKLSTNRALL